MTTQTVTTLLTAEEFYQLPEPLDGSRRELVKGEVVTMSPPGFYHCVVCSRVDQVLGAYVYQNKLGYTACNDPGVIVERDPDTVRGPDVAYWERTRVTNVMNLGYTDIATDLVVEVLSPHDVFTKVLRKVEEYFTAGVRLVWIVVPEDQSVAIYRPGQKPTVLNVNDTLTGENVVVGFTCPVASLFP